MKTALFKYCTLLVLFVLLQISCKQKIELPNAHTIGVKNTGVNSVLAYGSLVGLEIKAKGFCWDTLDNPDLNKNKIDLGQNSESFSVEVTGLTSGKRYFIRAYATNDAGTNYGTVTTFSTITAPLVTTNSIVVSSFSNAILSGSAPISNTMQASETGICYSTKPNPSISDSKKSNGALNNFTVTLIGLTENTTYYYRAYATYDFGTVYGKELSFKTAYAPVQYFVSGTMSDYDGNIYNTVTIGNQTWMTENLKVTTYDDGNPIPLVAGSFGNWSNISYGARCNLSDNITYSGTYGFCYNYRAAIDSRLIPAGWHLPSVAEWQTLIDKVGGNTAAISQLLASGNKWPSAYSCPPVNLSSMSLLPGGFRNSSGSDSFQAFSGYFWTSNIGSQSTLAKAMIFNSYCTISTLEFSYNTGCSIRLIKD